MPLVRDLPACCVTEPSRSTGPRFSLQTRARHPPFQPLGGAHLPREDLSRAPSWEGDGNPCSPPGDIGPGKVPFEIWIILKARDRPLPFQGQPETPWRDEAGLASAPGRLPRGWTLTSRPLPAVNAGLAVLCIRGLVTGAPAIWEASGTLAGGGFCNPGLWVWPCLQPLPTPVPCPFCRISGR